MERVKSGFSMFFLSAVAMETALGTPRRHVDRHGFGTIFARAGGDSGQLTRGVGSPAAVFQGIAGLWGHGLRSVMVVSILWMGYGEDI